MLTPGECVIKDAGCDVARDVSHSDLVILLTPMSFGGYSSELKKAVDRYAGSMVTGSTQGIEETGKTRCPAFLTQT
jgi:multimeric flavodoxin WrbA